MGTYIEIDGKLYVTKEDYLNIVKYYENSLSAERDGAKEKIEELEEENKKLKEENEELKEAMKELNNYNKFRIQENEKLKKENEELQEYKRMYEGLG